MDEEPAVAARQLVVSLADLHERLPTTSKNLMGARPSILMHPGPYLRHGVFDSRYQRRVLVQYMALVVSGTRSVVFARRTLRCISQDYYMNSGRRRRDKRIEVVRRRLHAEVEPCRCEL